MTIEQLEQEVARMQASGMYTQEQIESYIIQNAPNENDLGVQRQDTNLFGRSSFMPIQPVENVIQGQEQVIERQQQAEEEEIDREDLYQKKDFNQMKLDLQKSFEDLVYHDDVIRVEEDGSQIVKENNFTSRSVKYDFMNHSLYSNISVSADNFGNTQDRDTSILTLPNGEKLQVADGNENELTDAISAANNFYDNEDNAKKSSNPYWALFDRADSNSAIFANPNEFNSAMLQSGYYIKGISDAARSGNIRQPGETDQDKLYTLYKIDERTGMHTPVLGAEQETLFSDGTYTVGGASADEIQKYFWNEIDSADLAKTNDFMKRKSDAVLQDLSEKTTELKNKFYIKEDDPATALVNEAEFTEEAENFAFDSYPEEMAEMARNLIKNKIPQAEYELIQKFLEPGKLSEIDKEKYDPNYKKIIVPGAGQYTESVLDNFTKFNIEAMLNSDEFKALSEESQQIVRDNLDLSGDIMKLTMGQLVDAKIEEDANIYFEKLLKDNGKLQDAVYVRGVIDQGTSISNLKEKEKAYNDNLDLILDVSATETKKVSDELQALLDKAQNLGYGYHPEGKQGTESFKIVLDVPAGKEEEAKDLQNLIDSKLNEFGVLQDSMIAKVNLHMKKYDEFLVGTQRLKTQEGTAIKEFDESDVSRQDFFGAFRSMGYSTLAMFGSDFGLAGLKKEERITQAFETMLTFDQASETDQLGRYASRTFKQQLPNMLVAMALSPVGGAGFSALGMGVRGSTIAGNALVGFGIFGTGSGGSKRAEIYGMREAGINATKQLAELEKAFKEGKISEAQYVQAKTDLQKVEALGDISDAQMYSAMTASLSIEGGIATLFGTVPNSQRFLRAFGGLGDDAIRLGTNSFAQNLRYSGRQVLKEVGEEVFEETAIFAGDMFASNLILGTDVSFDGLTDVALSAIISAGPMQSTSNAYAAITGTMSTRGTYNKYMDTKQALADIDAQLRNATDPKEIQALKAQYLNTVRSMADIQSELEMDALAAGPEGVKNILQANQVLATAYAEAGITSTDSSVQIQRKLKKHKGTLSGSALRAFESKIKNAEAAINTVKRQVAKLHEDGASIESIYGERGTQVSEELSQTIDNWEDLSARDKALAVHNKIKAEDKKANIDHVRKADPEMLEAVERSIYDGKTFEESGRKNRKRSLEDDLMDRIMTQIHIRDHFTISQAREGNVSVESILSDPKLAENFTFLQAENEQDIIAKLEEMRDNGEIDNSEFQKLKREMEAMFSEGTEGATFGAFVQGKYITVGTEQQVRQALENGEILHGTVALHETTHALDTLTGLRGNSKNFAENLEKGLVENDMEWIDIAAHKRLASLRIPRNTDLYYDEYTKSVQDILGNKLNAVELNKARRISGQSNLRAFFNRQTTGALEFKNGKDALNFMVSNIDAFRKGEVSKRTQRMIDERGSLDRETSGTRFSQAGEQASERVQNLYEEQGVGAAMDIIDEFGGRVNKLVNKYQDVPGFDRQLLTDEINTGRRGILDMIIKYDQETNPGVPIAAYINKFLDKRAIEAANRILKTEFEDDVTEARGVATEAAAEPEVVSRTREGIRLADRFGERGQKIHDDAKRQVKRGVINTDNKTYKTLGNAVSEQVQTMFGVVPKPGNLTKGDVKNAQAFIMKHADTLMTMLPEGTDTSGKSTGVNKVLLEPFYEKGGRVSASKTGSKAGLAAQLKRDNITKQEFLETFGITPAGQPNISDRNTSARVKALIDQTGKAMTNQAAKEALIEQGKGQGFTFEDGKSKTLYSKTGNKLQSEYPAIGQAVLNKIQSEEGLQMIEDVTGNIQGAFNNLFTDEDIRALAMEQFGRAGKKEISLITRRFAKIGSELQQVYDEFSGFKPVKDVSVNVGILKQPLSQIIQGHIVNEITTHRQYYTTVVGENNVLDLSNPLDVEKARAGASKLGQRLAEKYGAEFNERFLVPGLAAASSRKRGFFTDGREDTRKLLGAVKGEIGNYSRPPSNYMDGNFSYDQVKKHVNNKDAIVKAQQENNNALRQIVEELRSMVEGKEISLAQATQILETLNSSQQGLTRSSAIFDFAPTKPFKLEPSLNRDGTPKLDSKGKPIMLGATLEHMTPALQVNLQALRYIATGEANQKTQFDQTMDNYRLAYLPKKYDDIVNLFYKSTVPYWQTSDMSPLGRYYGPQLLAAGFDLELSMLSTGVSIGGDAGITIDNWNRVNKERKDALGPLGGNDVGTIEQTRSNAKKANKEKSLYSRTGKKKGMTAWDFDDTLARTKSNVIFNKDGETKIVSAEDFATQGADLVAEGWVPDFSEFNKVTGGTPGPFFDKAMRRAKKYGTQDTFILTARAPESAPAIKEFLDSLGLNIPIENITGLGNSTGEAKARWLLDKHAQGYNDIAFADDALQNVEAVRKVFDEFDIKGKVEQAKTLFSRSAPARISEIISEGEADLNADLNIILEETKDVDRKKKFSPAKAKQRGKNKGKFKFFLPPSAEDFKGLMYPMLGKGQIGEQHHQWFKENLFDPYSNGMRRLNALQQETSGDLRALKRTHKDVKSKLKRKVPGTEFTYEQAIRVFNWNRNGVEVPGLSQSDLNKLTKAVKSDPQLTSFANGLEQILDKAEATVEPGDNWLGGTISMDIMETIDASRETLLQEWNNNVDVIFSKQNLNKLEAIFGSNYREALEDSIYRMKTGSTRNFGSNRLVNGFTQWLNGSIGTTMFFNARSAMLQMISNVNFINWSDNNLLAAGKAFANQKQYWTDVSMIFNSDFLKQRRAGLGTDLNAAELLKELQGSKNPMKTAISYLLQLGFTPTQAADSLAIATGGATMYRNRLNTYLEQGMSQQEAETKAFQDMREVAEETQQSTRPDKISQQQASPLGKWILAFQNTPMQYNRIIKRSAQDLVNGRGDNRANISKIIYYGAVQRAIFYGLQSALFSVMFGDDEEEDDLDAKKGRVVNGMVDSLLRGAGIGGAVVATVKNVIIEHLEQKAKEDDDIYMTEYNETDVLIEALNLSPPVGIKARKLVSGMRTWEYNQDVIDYMPKTDIDNPIYDASFAATEAVTNVPLSRLYNKVQNIRAALDSENETFKRVAMFLGWSRWSFGIQNQDVLSAKRELKEIKAEEAEVRAEERAAQREAERQAANKAVIQGHIDEQQEQRDNNVAEEEIQCAAVKRNGERCSNKVLPGESYCTIHQEVPQQANEVQCSHIKSNGDRCKMKTKNKSGKCYYHD